MPPNEALQRMGKERPPLNAKSLGAPDSHANRPGHPGGSWPCRAGGRERRGARGTRGPPAASQPTKLRGGALRTQKYKYVDNVHALAYTVSIRTEQKGGTHGQIAVGWCRRDR